MTYRSLLRRAPLLLPSLVDNCHRLLIQLQAHEYVGGGRMPRIELHGVSNTRVGSRQRVHKQQAAAELTV